MSRFFRRSILWLVPLIVIPVGAMFGIQYRFLRTLEKKTESAERSFLREVAEATATRVDGSFEEAARRTLTVERDCLCNAKILSRHFRNTGIAGASLYFSAEFNGKASYLFFGPDGTERKADAHEEQLVKLATVAWHTAHTMKRSIPHPEIVVDERDRHQRVLLRPVVDAEDRVKGAIGVVLDNARVKKAILAEGAAFIRTKYPDSAESLRVTLREPHARPPFRGPSHSLSFVFTDWRVAVHDACATPEQLAAISFNNNIMLAGGVMIVLLGALGMAMHAAWRQNRLSQMKSDFVSNVSHELRTPLASIRVFGEYMRLGRVTTDEKVREYGTYIEAEGRRLTTLINNILDFSKIESAEKKYKFAPVDLVSMVRDTTTAFAVPLAEKGFAVTFVPPPSPVPEAVVDRDALAQAVLNLLDNAVKYSGESRQVEASVGVHRNGVRISVRDHGIGIPKSEQRKIFGKFYRVSSGLVHDVKGSGLGLAIVKHIVRAHGGTVEVESEPGKGATFSIVLPGAPAVRESDVARGSAEMEVV